MFSKKRSATVTPAPPPTIAVPPHQRPASSSTTTANAPPLVSPLQMTFDFEIPSAPALSSSPFKGSLDSLRPKTSDGAREGKSNVNLAPPVLPPIPRVASQVERQEVDVPFTSFTRPTSSFSPMMPVATEARPSTSTGSTPRMEPSLFPTKEQQQPSSPMLPPINTGPAMSRAWIDSRDRSYAPPQSRTSQTRPTQNSPDILSTTRSPSMNFSTRSPLSPPTSSPSTTSRPSPPSFATSPNLSQLQRPPSHPTTSYSGSTARSTRSSKSTTTTDSQAPTLTVGTPYQETSPSFPLPQHVSTRPKTANATTTASIAGVSIPTHHSSSLLPTQASLNLTQNQNPTPTPQPARTQTSTPKSEKRKTRLNPLNLLARRRSGQDDSTSTAHQISQARALQRQQKVAAVGVSKIPEDFDPRIRGKVVHDFSAPRGPPSTRRNFSYNDKDSWEASFGPAGGAGSAVGTGSVARGAGLGSASSAPLFPPTSSLQQDAQVGGRSSGGGGLGYHSNKASDSTDRSSLRRSLHTAMFTEHFPSDETLPPSMRIQAEKLENKKFLQRASQQSSVSQESAVLPPFARRSQVMDPLQAAYIAQYSGGSASDEESKRCSDPASSSSGGGYAARDSNVSSISPVTARSSAALASSSSGSGAGMGVDVRASLSPVSPSSPAEKRGSGRPVSEMSRPASDVARGAVVADVAFESPEVSSAGARVRSPSEGTMRPFSGQVAQQPGVESIAEESPRIAPGKGTMPMFTPPPVREPPQIPARTTSVLPPTGPDMLVLPPRAGSATSSRSALSSIPSNQPTPEPQVAQTVTATRASNPPKLVEKRGSAVGHGKRMSSSRNTPMKHRVSDASRFSFQFAGASASVAEEMALEAKARQIGVESGAGGSEEDEEEFFDEDAMDDLDEMEVQAQLQGGEVEREVGKRKSIAQFMYRTPTLSPAVVPLPNGKGGGKGKEKGSAWQQQLRMMNDSESVGSESEGEGEGEDEAPYWMHEDFQGNYSDEEEEMGHGPSNPPSAAEALPSTNLSHARRTSGGQRQRGASATLTLDTKNVHLGIQARSGFYMQPMAAGYSPTAERATVPAPTLPHRESGNSERNRVASGFSFAPHPPARASHRAAFSTSTADSGGSVDEILNGQRRAFSPETVGGSTGSSEPRTISTGLGLSGFSDFKFMDSPASSRPTSMQVEGPGKRREYGGRRKDSETLPQSGDWTGEERNRKSSPLLQQEWDSAEGRVVGDGGGVVFGDDDDMYFDDGGFERDVNDVANFGGGVDEDAFDDDEHLFGSEADGLRDVVREVFTKPTHQRDLSAMTVTSLGSDGPYPSFAMPNPAKARERDSRLMLEDLPLQAPIPVDPKLIPQRNPSEDAKRLGLSNKVPPLPLPSGSLGDLQKQQSRMHAWHASLAEAANQAAVEGRFLRMPSGSTVGTGRSLSAYSRDGKSGSGGGSVSEISRDRSQYSRNEDGEEVPPSLPRQVSGNENPNADLDRNGSNEMSRSKLDRSTTYTPPKLSFDFGFAAAPFDEGSMMLDDDLGNDDDIVAAANAEALAFDDDGFYGQEFGFYAKARPNSGEDVQAFNGGYFGPDGDDGVMRNKSLKEPNLTPITERSEFSTRNSFVGLGPQSAGGLPVSAVSPALARLPVFPLGEEEITSFDQLRKLRAHAFGGSSGSLHSDVGKGGPHPLPVGGASDSPTWSTRSSAAAQGYFGPLDGAPMTFGYSTESSASASSNPSNALPVQQPGPGFYAGFQQDSPHSAASSGHLPFSASAADVDVTPRKALPADSSSSPMTARKVTGNKARTHSRNSSGADSVTYVREQDPAGTGQPRWVLERRRTSEQGNLELIGREIVQGGWI